MQEFLTELGIPEEAATAIIQRMQEMEQERDEAKSALEALKGEFSAHRLDTAIQRSLSEAGAKNLTAAAALLDKSSIAEDENGFSGISEQVAAIKKECPYLFRGMEVSSGMRQKAAPNQDSFTSYARIGAKIEKVKA